MISVFKKSNFLALFFIVSFKPSLSSAFVAKEANQPSPSFVENKIKKAVWMISARFSQRVTGTAFFISKNHVITNFHVVDTFIMNGMNPEFYLFQEGTTKQFKIKRVLSISPYYDLALLEVEGSHEHFLTLPENKPMNCDKQGLYTLGYPNGEFDRINQIKQKDSSLYENSFYVNRISPLSGLSGGPVLDHCENLIGVSYTGGYNLLRFIPWKNLYTFLEDENLFCEGSVPSSCIHSNYKKELDI